MTILLTARSWLTNGIMGSPSFTGLWSEASGAPLRACLLIAFLSPIFTYTWLQLRALSLQAGRPESKVGRATLEWDEGVALSQTSLSGLDEWSGERAELPTAPNPLAAPMCVTFTRKWLCAQGPGARRWGHLAGCQTFHCLWRVRQCTAKKFLIYWYPR